MKKINVFTIFGIICSVLIVLFVVLGAIICLVDTFKDNENNSIKDDFKLVKLNYKLSDKFIFSNYTDSKYYSLYEDYVSCNIHIKYDEIDKYNNYSNGRDYLLDKINIKIKDKYDGPNKVNLNNKNWYKLNVVSNDNSVLYYNYYAATKYKNKIYYIEYKISDYNYGDTNKDNSICYSYVEEFFYSLKFE